MFSVIWKSALKRAEPTLPREIVKPDEEIPYDEVCLEVAEIAIAEVNARLKAHMDVKSATENRATTLANNCIAVMTFISGAAFYDFKLNGTSAVTIAATCCLVFLYSSIAFAYTVIKPGTIALPGRLPSQLWTDMITPGMDKKDFLLRLFVTSQQEMFDNEISQNHRGRSLRNATIFAMLAAPIGLLGFLLARTMPGF